MTPATWRRWGGSGWWPRGGVMGSRSLGRDPLSGLFFPPRSGCTRLPPRAGSGALCCSGCRCPPPRDCGWTGGGCGSRCGSRCWSRCRSRCWSRCGRRGPSTCRRGYLAFGVPWPITDLLFLVPMKAWSTPGFLQLLISTPEEYGAVSRLWVIFAELASITWMFSTTN